MKTIKNFSAITFLALVLSNCVKDDTLDVTPGPVQESPIEEPEIQDRPSVTLESIDPLAGPKETLVTIMGNNFGNDPNKVQVFFNNKESEIQSIENTKIITAVPIGASTGPVKIAVDGTVVMGPEFDYELTLVVKPYAGSTFGLEDGTLETAKFINPTDMAQDSKGNLYITDSGNHMIRKIDANGNVTTYAGIVYEPNSTVTLEDGFRTDAIFNRPSRIAIDNQDNIYISDSGNNAIRKITPEGDVVTIVQKFSNDIGVKDSLVRPNGIAMDPTGTLYVGDTGNNRILKVNPNGRVQLLVGSDRGFTDGIGFFSQFNAPHGIILGDDSVYVADAGNNSIRKVGFDGLVITLAGNGIEGSTDGNATEATFSEPLDVALDNNGNLIVLDTANGSIRQITKDGQVITLLKMDNEDMDGGEDATGLNDPSGLFRDANGTWFIMDRENHKIKILTYE
ncbi:MAG: IPT/TIG domain-containing protein [Bacteroidota bacterium]